MRKPFLENRSGSVTVEFIAVSLVFFTIFFAIIGFGIHMATRIGLTYAVAEGGRAALSGLNQTDRKKQANFAIDSVLTAYSPLIVPDNAVVEITETSTELGISVKVSISYADSRFFNLPFIPALNDLPPVETTFLVVSGSF